MIGPPEKLIALAEKAARQSPCAKSQRGAAVLDGRGNMCAAWNRLPPPARCDGSDACRASCGARCIHAEQQVALMSLAMTYYKPLTILHVKLGPVTLPMPDPITPNVLVERAQETSAGEPIMQVVPSGPPSCMECAKLLLALDFAKVWLLHEDGWKEYTALEFFQATARTLGYPEK